MSLPVIDEKRIEDVYHKFGQMTCTLDADPLQFGPSRLNEKISEVRAMMTHCEQIVLQISKDLHAYKREHRRYRVEYEIREAELLATDPDVRGRSNLTDRKAVIAQKLKPERQMLNNLEFSIQDLEVLEKVAGTKRQDLRDITARLKDQVNLCREQLGTGERWGRAGAQGYDPQPRVQGKHKPHPPTIEVPDLVGEMESFLKEQEGCSESDLLPKEEPAKELVPINPDLSSENVESILASLDFLL